MLEAKGIMHWRTTNDDTDPLSTTELLPPVMTPYSLQANTNRGHIKMVQFRPAQVGTWVGRKCRSIGDAVNLHQQTVQILASLATRVRAGTRSCHCRAPKRPLILRVVTTRLQVSTMLAT